MIKFDAATQEKEKTAADLMMEAALASDEAEAMRLVEKQAASIANLMASIHGGDWLVKVDHQKQAVMIWSLPPLMRS